MQLSDTSESVNNCAVKVLSIQQNTLFTMVNKTVITMMCILLMINLYTLHISATAPLRRMPLNGSIYGKRTAEIDISSTSKTLSAMCDITMEACSEWFPNEAK